LATEADARKAGHTRPQQPIRILNQNFDRIETLGVLIGHWLGVYLRDSACEYLAGHGLQLEPHGAVESDASDLTLANINLEQEFPDLANAADLLAAVVAAADHLAQIITKDYTRIRRDYCHSFGLAAEQFMPLPEGFELLSIRV
jgi:hypothetical protein